MNSGNTKILALLAVIFMLTASMPVLAAASPSENSPGLGKHYQIHDGNMSGFTPMNYTRIQDREQYSKQMQQDYQKAKNNLTHARAMLNNGTFNGDEMFNVSKDYLNTTIEYMNNRLMETKTSLEENNGTEEQIEHLEGYIKELEGAQEELENAETQTDLANISKSLREICREANKEINQNRVVHLSGGLENYVMKAERISERLGTEIIRLNESGSDTSEEEDMLDEYNSHVEDVSKYLNLAKETNDTDEAVSYVKSAITSIEKANETLRNLLDEIKDQRPGFIKLADSETLSAEGDGTAVISGNMDIELSVNDADLMINDLAGDATIEVEGEYDPASDDKSTGEETATQGYHNFTGKASISGSRLTVVVHGSDIYLETEGSGSVMLSGEGSYKLDGYNGSSYTFNWAHVIDEDTDNENEEIE